MNLSSNKQLFLNYITNSINDDKLNHCFLLEVNNYEEDFDFLLNLIKYINCDKNHDFDSLNCNLCNKCTLISNLNYPDLIIIESEKNFISKDIVLDSMSELSNKSLIGNKRFLIIKNSELLNLYSSNTMLKFLEEPPSDVFIFLICENRYKIINTILSRCLIFNISDNNTNISLNDNDISLINFFEERKLFSNYKSIINDYLVDKNSCKLFLSKLKVILINVLENKNSDYFKNWDSSDLIKLVLIIENEVNKLDYNVNYKLFLDGMFAKIMLI